MPPVPLLFRSVYPRKGSHSSGEGHGSHSSGDGDEDGDSDGSSSHSSSEDEGKLGSTKKVSMSGSTLGKPDAVAYGAGGGHPITIPKGEPFAGQLSGGGTRGEVYGTSEYGSGYPGLSAGSVSDRDLPFVFWPVVWRSRGYGAPYLYDPEYGTPWNTSRPGGPLASLVLASSTSNNTFYAISDSSTVAALIAALAQNCTAGTGDALSQAPSPFNATAAEPQPEQAVQYYRASSVVLLLDGYNDTDALAETGGDPNASAVALPGWVNMTLLTCLNDTIGEAVPLFSGASAGMQGPNVAGIIMMWLLVWRLLHEWYLAQ